MNKSLYAILLAFLALSVLFAPATCMAESASSVEADFEKDLEGFNPSDIDRGLQLAKKYIALERFDLAERVFKAVYERKPLDFKFYYQYASFLVRLNRDADAIEVLETCRDEKGIFAYDVEIMLGKLYFKIQDYRKSARLFEKVGMINTIYSEPLFYWSISATFLGLEGEPKKAIEVLEKRFPGSPYIALANAVFLYYAGEFEQAEKLISTLTVSEKTPGFYYVICSALFIQNGQYDKAKVMLDKGIEADPLTQGLYTNMAILALITEKNPASAKTVIDQAMKYDSFQELSLARAYYEYITGDTDDAKTILLGIMKEKRSLYYSNYLLGVILYQEMEKLLSSKDDSPEENKKKAEPLMQQAIDYLNYCTSSGKDFFAAYFMLGRISFLKGEYENALAHLERAAKLSPKDKPTQVYIGHAYLKLKKINEARRMFEAVVQTDSNNVDALNALAYISAITGDTDEAISYFEKALVIDPRSEYAKKQLQYLKNLEKERTRAGR